MYVRNIVLSNNISILHILRGVMNMNSIKKNLPFGDKVFVARQEYNNLSYTNDNYMI